MTIAPDHVRKIFVGLEAGAGAGAGAGAAFFAHVADDVDWTVMDTHLLAVHYLSKADVIVGTFAKLGQVLPRGARLHLERLSVNGDQAAVELRSLAIARNGIEIRQSIVLDRLLRGRKDRARSRLSRLGHGCQTVRRESSRYVRYESSRPATHNNVGAVPPPRRVVGSPG